MKQLVRDLMTPDPITISADASIRKAAQMMAENDVGTVVVLKERGGLCGVVTDRDVVVRAVAKGLNAEQASIHEICSHELATVTPDTLLDEALAVLRGKAIRRLPVVEGDKVVGVIALGDLAVDRDPESVLGQISRAPANS